LDKRVSYAKTWWTDLNDLYVVSYDVFLCKELMSFGGRDDCTCVKISVALIAINSFTR